MIDQFIEGLRYYDVSLKVYFAILETHTSKEFGPMRVSARTDWLNRFFLKQAVA